MFWQNTLRCRACTSHRLRAAFSLGETPLADRLADEACAADAQRRAPLDLLVCADCSLLQLSIAVPPRELYSRGYPYYSSISPSLTRHFAASAAALAARLGLGRGATVIEAASNDGCLLRHFRDFGCRVLGIDPAEGPAESATAGGVTTIMDFFGRELAESLRRDGWRADLFVANNVLAHVPDLEGFVDGIALILATNGHVSIEVPYVADLIRQNAFDTIYHQHLCYFSMTSLVPLFAKRGLVIAQVERIAMQGGSLRLLATRGGRETPDVARLCSDEQANGFADGTAYAPFRARIDAIATALRRELDTARGLGIGLAGYGAAAKATTLMSVCGIGRGDLEFIADLNPAKQGRFMPGVGIPIAAPSRIAESNPGAILLFAWNYADEVIAAQRIYRRQGGRFVIPLPWPRTVADG